MTGAPTRPSSFSLPRTVRPVRLTGRDLIFPFFSRADVERFYAQCDPDKENLCLYGNPDGTWEVQLPAEEVPPELPEPALGINFARDGMQVRLKRATRPRVGKRISSDGRARDGRNDAGRRGMCDVNFIACIARDDGGKERASDRGDVVVR